MAQGYFPISHNKLKEQESFNIIMWQLFDIPNSFSSLTGSHTDIAIWPAFKEVKSALTRDL